MIALLKSKLGLQKFNLLAQLNKQTYSYQNSYSSIEEQPHVMRI